MSQLEKIKEFMSGKEKVSIGEIEEGTGILNNSVRGTLNISVKKGEHFQRLGEGYYKLLEDKFCSSEKLPESKEKPQKAEVKTEVKTSFVKSYWQYRKEGGTRSMKEYSQEIYNKEA